LVYLSFLYVPALFFVTLELTRSLFSLIKQQPVSKFYSTTAVDLMELVSQQWQLELAWAQRLRERVVATQAQGGDRDTTACMSTNPTVAKKDN